MRTNLLKFVFLGAISLNPAYASGIPVVDTAAIAQGKLQFMKEITEWGKSLNEAKARLQQLKQSYKAVTGIRDIADIIDEKKIKRILSASFDDLMNGNYDAADKYKKLLTTNNPCRNLESTHKKQCNSQRETAIVNLSFLENVTDTINDKSDYLTRLSKKIRTATDMKSISDLQASIAIESNSINLLKTQVDAFLKTAELKSTAYKKILTGKMIDASKNAFSSTDGANSFSFDASPYID